MSPLKKLLGLSIAAGALALSPAQNPVTCMITYPTDSEVVSNTITLNVSASSSIAPISRVEYYLDGALIATVTNPVNPPAGLSLTVTTP